LILVFANVGAILLFLQVEFLALVYIIVYLGAIAVLFLFAVMMLNIKLSPIRDAKYNYAPLAIVITFILATELTYSLNASISETFYSTPAYLSFSMLLHTQNTAQLALILFLFLTTPFLIIALVLLIALIGAVTLTLTDNTEIRHQEITNQLKATILSVRTLP
jgi:NADH-quinone oxidoreductase subunit J